MKPFDFALYGVVLLGWSTSWLPLKWQVGVVAPEVSLIWRFAIAAVIMFAFALIARRPLGLSWRGHAVAMALGVCLFSCNFTLFYYGALGLASGLLAVVFASASLINLFYSAAVFRTPLTPMGVGAALLGFAGIATIYWPEIAGSEAALPSLLLCLAGTTFFCTGNMVSTAAQKRKYPITATTAFGMLYGAIFLTLIALVRGSEFTFEPTWKYIGGGLWLALFSSVLAFGSYLTLLGRIGAGKAAYATVIFPIFALLISTFAEGYQWSIFAVVGLVMVLSGLLLMNRARTTR